MRQHLVCVDSHIQFWCIFSFCKMGYVFWQCSAIHRPQFVKFIWVTGP